MRAKRERRGNGIALAIDDSARRHRHLEIRRTRFILAAFLSKMRDRNVSLGETVADLQIGECSVVEYVEELIDAAREWEAAGWQI